MRYLIIFLAAILTIYLINAPIYVLYHAAEKSPLFFLLISLLGPIFFIILSFLSHYSYKINIYGVAFISFILYLCWGIYASVTPYSDFGEFYNLSVQYASSFDTKILFQSKSPTTTIYYAFFAFMFGKSYLTFYIASSLIWSVQVIILYKALSNFKQSENESKFIATMYGLYPGIIFYATVVSSESIFMFFLVSSLYLVSKIYNNTFKKKDAVALGVVFSLFFLTRGNAIVFIIPYIIYFIFSKNIFKKHMFLLVIAIILPLLFQLSLNIKYGDRYSFSASEWGAYNLMVGTNPKSNGGYSLSDFRLAGYEGENKVTLKEAQKNSIKIAFHRITDNPIDFILFSTTTKIKTLWETDLLNIFWSIGNSPKKKDIWLAIKVGGTILEASFLMLLLTSIGYLTERLCRYKEIINRKISIDLLLLTIIPLVLLALLHIFIEVQPRYHLPFLPFLTIFSGIFIMNKYDFLKK